jgi:hypothetical protein
MERALAAIRGASGGLLPRSEPEQGGLAGFFLARLRHLAPLKSMDGLSGPQRRLVNVALYSTYLDCEQLGLRTEARLILGLPVDRTAIPDTARSTADHLSTRSS